MLPKWFLTINLIQIFDDLSLFASVIHLDKWPLPIFVDESVLNVINFFIVF